MDMDSPQGESIKIMSQNSRIKSTIPKMKKKKSKYYENNKL